jgi:photosystem II stability/assembly factor-like uncharacterized protein
MKKSIVFSKHALWISLLLYTYLISACGTFKIHLEGTVQTSDNTPASTVTSLPIEVTPSQTPNPTQSAAANPSNTPTVRPGSTKSPAPIPHFSAGDSIIITQIEMFDASTGWAIGRKDSSRADHILTTIDGGFTWRDVTPPESLPETEGEFMYKQATGVFLNGESAKVIYNPAKFGDPVVIWNTSSRGVQWAESDSFNSIFYSVQDLYYSDVSHGWLMLNLEGGMGHAWIELYRTYENWWEWELLIDPYSEASADLHYCCKNGMAFHDFKTGLVTFGRGPMGGAFINWTNDGGLTWEMYPLPRPEGYFWELEDGDYGYLCESHSPNLFSSLNAKVALECHVAFDNPDLVSFIFVTLDGGINWQSELYPGGEIHFLDSKVGWALGKDIYQTEDGGQTWTKMSTVQWEGQFSFVSKQLGWAVAQKDEEYALLQTSDGGKFWNLIEPVVLE